MKPLLHKPLMKIYFVGIVLLFCCANVQAKSRYVYLEKELRAASYAGEVVITGYATKTDSVSGKLIIQSISCRSKDSTFTLLPWSKTQFPVAYNLTSSMPKREVEEGYWPDIGDTVLVVTDGDNRVSLFAEIMKEEYKFWSPYSTDAWTTVFYFNAPAKIVAYPGKLKKLQQNLEKHAMTEGYAYGSLYHCLLPKSELEKYRK
jgi:hypothetical protein